MISVGTRELKNNLSRYLVTVKNGEDIVITVHGRAVARIIPEPVKKMSLKNRLSVLATEGFIRLPKKRTGNTKPINAPGKPLSDMVVEDRR